MGSESKFYKDMLIRQRQVLTGLPSPFNGVLGAAAAEAGAPKLGVGEAGEEAAPKENG